MSKTKYRKMYKKYFIYFLFYKRCISLVFRNLGFMYFFKIVALIIDNVIFIV